jgi:hypothetical protein
MVAAPFGDMVSVLSLSDLTVFDKLLVRFIVLSPLSVLAVSALIAPRLQLFTYLICKDLDAGQWDPKNGGTIPDMRSVGSIRPISCAADPVVQANVAKFLTGLCHSVPFRASYVLPIIYDLRNGY